MQLLLRLQYRVRLSNLFCCCSCGHQLACLDYFIHGAGIKLPGSLGDVSIDSIPSGLGALKVRLPPPIASPPPSPVRLDVSWC
jgi:hypothetical protein